MKFRVSSITGTEEGSAVGAVTVELQGQLNVELSGKVFGSNLDQVTVITVTAFDEIEVNEKWAASLNRLGHVTNEFTGERFRHLSFGVALWAAACFEDTLLRWNPKPEVGHGNETAIQPGVQA